MYFLQSLIIGAVVIHNEYNHWTPKSRCRNHRYSVPRT